MEHQSTPSLIQGIHEIYRQFGQKVAKSTVYNIKKNPIKLTKNNAEKKNINIYLSLLFHTLSQLNLGSNTIDNSSPNINPPM